MTMITAQAAADSIFQQIQPLQPQTDAEMVPLAELLDRILATAVTSDRDFPHWDNSAMDGYAVRFADVQLAQADRPIALEVIEEIAAGSTPQKMLAPGQAARIFTGAILPKGADTIVMQEETRAADGQVLILAAPAAAGAFVRRQGSFYRAGTPLLAAGLPLRAPEIAILAAAQKPQVSVLRRLRVAILSTGSELVLPEQPLQQGQIVDSNQYALMALVQQMGAVAVPLGIVADRPEPLKQAITAAIAQADVVISSGGVSVGEYDYVDRVLAELGANIQIRSVAIKPGKPLTFATLGSAQYYFGLPGNPVSALVTFWRFVQPALRKLSGLTQGWQPQFVSAITAQTLRSQGQRETYLWGCLETSCDPWHFHLADGQQNSGNLISLAGTNALGVIPIGQTEIPAGSQIRVLRLPD